MAGIAADLHQVADHDAFIPFAQPLIAKFDQAPLNPTVAVILVTDDGKGNCLGARQKRSQLIGGREAFEFHYGYHSYHLERKPLPIQTHYHYLVKAYTILLH